MRKIGVALVATAMLVGCNQAPTGKGDDVAALASAAAGRFAIKCTGTVTSTLTGPETTSHETRTYIIDADASTVGRWSDVKRAAPSICDDGIAPCRFDFYPGEISVEGRRGDVRLEWHLMREQGIVTENAMFGGPFELFAAQCEKVPEPKANSTRLKF